jgi:hypothetical protein
MMLRDAIDAPPQSLDLSVQHPFRHLSASMSQPVTKPAQLTPLGSALAGALGACFSNA